MFRKPIKILLKQTLRPKSSRSLNEHKFGETFKIELYANEKQKHMKTEN